MLLQNERGASQHKQIIDTHRKHILDMAIGTSKELYIQLTECTITGSISAKVSVRACRHGCDAKLQEHISSLTRIHSKIDIVGALLLCLHFPVFTRLQPVFG